MTAGLPSLPGLTGEELNMLLCWMTVLSAASQAASALRRLSGNGLRLRIIRTIIIIRTFWRRTCIQRRIGFRIRCGIRFFLTGSTEVPLRLLLKKFWNGAVTSLTAMVKSSAVICRESATSLTISAISAAPESTLLPCLIHQAPISMIQGIISKLIRASATMRLSVEWWKKHTSGAYA
ncbi:hypothetical protein D3C80_1398490 [compost metagenome]